MDVCYLPTEEREYWGPADEKQFESMCAAHLTYLILDSQQQDPLFRVPIPDTAKNILDIGMGNGTWVVETADKCSSATVQAVDLSLPADNWAPANCVFEVDDGAPEVEFQGRYEFRLY